MRAERLPGGGPGDAVDREPVGGLEAADRALGCGAEFAVHGDVQRGLQALHRVGRGVRGGAGVFGARARATSAGARPARGFFAGANHARGFFAGPRTGFPGRSAARAFEDRGRRVVAGGPGAGGDRGAAGFVRAVPW